VPRSCSSNRVAGLVRLPRGRARPEDSTSPRFLQVGQVDSGPMRLRRHWWTVSTLGSLNMTTRSSGVRWQSGRPPRRMARGSVGSSVAMAVVPPRVLGAVRGSGAGRRPGELVYLSVRTAASSQAGEGEGRGRCGHRTAVTSAASTCPGRWCAARPGGSSGYVSAVQVGFCRAPSGPPPARGRLARVRTLTRLRRVRGTA
jgi:hypothetical protein